MLAILTSKLGLAGIALVLVLSVFGIQAARLAHANAEITSMKNAQKLAKADVRNHEAKASKISSEASGELEKAKASVQIRYRTLVQRIPQEIPEEADRDCVVSPAWISIWNEGARP